jgi:glycerophosphoryl diester phosphodiesterase
MRGTFLTKSLSGYRFWVFISACLMVGNALRAEVLSISHRGASGEYPENTLVAFSAAMPVTQYQEFDVYPSGDGVLVVIHDATVDRTTDGTGSVASKTVAELKTLDAGSWKHPDFAGERIPTLAETINHMLPQCTPLIERKGGTANQYVSELQALGVTSNVVLKAFDWNFVGDVHALDPDIELGALGSGTLSQSQLDTILSKGAHIVSWAAGSVSAATVDLVHANGMKLFVWTVNSTSDMQRFIDMGVDGILSDYPDRVFDLLPPPGALNWSAQSTLNVSTNAATAYAEIDTNLTETVLVWEETDTAPGADPGSTNDWAYRLSLNPVTPGSVNGEMSDLAVDTEYTWRFFGVSATTSGWSSATTFATALSDAQAPEFVSAQGASVSTIALSWQDNAAQETSYILRRSTNSSSGPYTTMDVGNTTTALDAGLSPETTYYYALAATNGSNGSVTDFARAVTNATTLGIGSGGQTVIRFNGMTQNSNAVLPADFGSNLSSDIPGAAVFNGGTPDIALSWSPHPETGGSPVWEVHGSTVWNALDPANSGVDVCQIDLANESAPPDPTVTFTVADGLALQLNSLDLGNATDQSEAPFSWTITISEVGGLQVFSYTTAAMSGGDTEHVTFDFTGDDGVDYVLRFTPSTFNRHRTAIDNLSFSQVADSIPGDIFLSSTRIVSNALPGSLVGILSYNTNDQSNITYELRGTGPDNDRFQITGVNDLRTVATIDKSLHNISIAAQKDGVWLATNVFAIAVDPVASTYAAFRVAAEVASGVAGSGKRIGVLQAVGADASPFTFSLSGGRTDLFEVDGTGTNLVQVTGTDPGPVGSIHYVEIQAANAATTNHLVVGVQVMKTSSGFLFIVR